MKSLAPAALILLLLCAPAARGQAGGAAPKSPAEAEAEKAFREGNALMEQRKYAEALARYREGLQHFPSDPSLLYNASTAAVVVGDFVTAAPYLKQLVGLYPEDWQSRAKLIQTYQALGDLKARDTHRTLLFDLRQRGGGEDKERPERSLAQQEVYCRDRFEAGGRKVMVFEHFELKGPRALRYAFIVLDEAGDRESSRISLGSYDSTNSFWAELNKEKARQGRLFHLDGYFRDGSHATYGMYHPEPPYDEVRAVVVKILEGEKKPISSSAPGRPAPAAPAEPKKP